MYYYISSQDKSGRFVVLGPYLTHSRAQGVADDLDGPYEITQLKTSDISIATRILKHRKFEETKDLEKSIKRASHKVVIK